MTDALDARGELSGPAVWRRTNYDHVDDADGRSARPGRRGTAEEHVISVIACGQRSAVSHHHRLLSALGLLDHTRHSLLVEQWTAHRPVRPGYSPAHTTARPSPRRLVKYSVRWTRHTDRAVRPPSRVPASMR